VVAHCAIKETLQQQQQQKYKKKAAAAIEENPSLISPKVADGRWLLV